MKTRNQMRPCFDDISDNVMSKILNSLLTPKPCMTLLESCERSHRLFEPLGAFGKDVQIGLQMAKGVDTSGQQQELLHHLQHQLCRAYSGSSARDVVVAEHNACVFGIKYKQRVPNSKGLPSHLQPLEILSTLDAAERVHVSPYGMLVANGNFVRLKVRSDGPFVWTKPDTFSLIERIQDFEARRSPY